MPRVRKSKWVWDSQRDSAAELIADGSKSRAKIAEAVGVTEVTLYDWLAVPEFKARVDDRRRIQREEIEQRGIAMVVRRQTDRQEEYDLLESVRVSRAANYGDVAGGDTGLVVRRTRVIGTGKNAQTVEEEQIDTGWLSARARLRDESAIDLGQRKNAQVEVSLDPIALAATLDEKLAQLARRVKPAETNDDDAQPDSR